MSSYTRQKYAVKILLVLHHHLGPVHTARAGGSGVSEVNELAVFALQDHGLTAVPPRVLPYKRSM